MQPSYTACIAPLNYVDIGVDGKPYIVKYIEGERQWMRLSSADTEQYLSDSLVRCVNKQKRGPSTSASCYEEGDVVEGADYNSYRVVLEQGQKTFQLYQLRYSWCNTGITYVTISESDLDCQSSAKLTKNSSRGGKRGKGARKQ